MPLIRDSHSKPSWTYTLSIPAIILITLWFIAGGVDIQVGDFHLLTATKSGLEYAAAVGAWLGFLGHRNWMLEVSKRGNPGTVQSVGGQ